LDAVAFPVSNGQVHVVAQRCKGCSFCIEFCPRDVLVESEETNAKGFHFPVVAQDKVEDCAHCEFCTIVCPEFAIYTVEQSAMSS